MVIVVVRITRPEHLVSLGNDWTFNSFKFDHIILVVVALSGHIYMWLYYTVLLSVLVLNCFLSNLPKS